MLKSTAAISDIRLNAPGYSGRSEALKKWRDSVFSEFGNSNVQTALNSAWDLIPADEGTPPIAELLRHEVNAVHEFQLSILDTDTRTVAANASSGRVQRPLMKAIDMVKTVLASLVDILPDLPGWLGQLFTILHEVLGILA